MFIIFFLIFLGVVLGIKNWPKTKIYQLTTEWEVDGFRFKAHKDSPMNWKTDLYVGKEQRPQLSLGGYYLGSRFEDLGIKTPFLEVSLLHGQLASFHGFKYVSKQLEEIPFFGADGKKLLGVWSSADPEYKDIDGDKVKEMLVYHPHYPPKETRTVEIYKYTGKIFQKEKEYEENTDGVYY